MNNNSSILHKAFIEAENRQIVLVPPDNQIDWEPSTRFEKKMKHLIRVQNKFYWSFINTAGKKVACFALAILLAFGSAMSVEAVREPVIKFIVEVHEKFTNIFYPEQTEVNVPQTIETEYTLSHSSIPDGFVFIASEATNFSNKEVFKNSYNAEITLRQSVINNSNITFDTENNTLIDIMIGDLKGFYYSNKGYHHIIWETNEYLYMLSTPDNIPLNNLFEMAQNIEIKK